MIADLEKQLSGIQQDFVQALQRIGGKENEKFDLIFAILSELQNRQAQLEESVRAMKAFQFQQGSFGSSQLYGQMNALVVSNHMMQFPGVMCSDASKQVVSSPSASGMQYASPMMMLPAGAQQLLSQQVPLTDQSPRANSAEDSAGLKKQLRVLSAVGVEQGEASSCPAASS